jgi:hypothetical protein
MTHRDDQNMRRRIKSIHIADYALPVDGEFAAAERRRMASYACPRPCAIGEGWLCTAPEGALRSPPGGADLPAARVLQQPRDGVRQAG